MFTFVASIRKQVHKPQSNSETRRLDKESIVLEKVELNISLTVKTESFVKFYVSKIQKKELIIYPATTKEKIK